MRPVGTADEDVLDRLNSLLLQGINDSGDVYLSHTRAKGRYGLRLAIGNVRTTETHVAKAWQIARRVADRVLLEA
jgi:aromatic-L-amino-acid decarboxylase